MSAIQFISKKVKGPDMLTVVRIKHIHHMNHAEQRLANFGIPIPSPLGKFHYVYFDLNGTRISVIEQNHIFGIDKSKSHFETCRLLPTGEFETDDDYFADINGAEQAVLRYFARENKVPVESVRLKLVDRSDMSCDVVECDKRPAEVEFQ